MLASMALSLIDGYQRWLSPRKGFGCAFRIAHGGSGCSGFARAAIRDHGVWRALPLVRDRFSACHDAAEELRDEKAKREKSKWYDYCDCGGCPDVPVRGCGKTANAIPDCDCTPDCCSL